MRCACARSASARRSWDYRPRALRVDNAKRANPLKSTIARGSPHPRPIQSERNARVIGANLADVTAAASDPRPPLPRQVAAARAARPAAGRSGRRPSRWRSHEETCRQNAGRRSRARVSKAQHGRAVAQDHLTRRALGAGCKITFRSRGHRRQCVLRGPREPAAPLCKPNGRDCPGHFGVTAAVRCQAEAAAAKPPRR
jgi:hypothetical protein